jgi:broad specificity phosphatase PhoE
MTRLILMRHAATAANLCRPYTLQGSRPDAPLAPEGVRQARLAAASLSQIPIHAVYSSPLIRALATAEALGRPVTVERALAEVDVGEWAGLTWEEVARRWPAEHAAFEEDAELHGYTGGENLAQVRARVVPAVEDIAASNTGRTVLVVCHGVVNRVLLAHWMGVPLRCARNLPQDNTGYNVIDFVGGKAKVRTLNRADHLEASRAA